MNAETTIPTQSISDALAKALVTAQLSIGKAQKNSTNPHLKNAYANLTSVIDACAAALHEHGIAVVQLPTTNVGENALFVSVETRLIHESGAYISNTLTLPCAKADPQGVGSAITYARRYALSAMAGVSPDDDDDGNGASRKPQSKTTERAANAAAAAAPKGDADPAIIAALQAEATKGLQALTAKWGSLTADQRAAVGSDFGPIRKAAQEADNAG